jgi:hypothetical protein
LLGVVLLVVATAAHADIDKCKTESGRTIYQEGTCPPGSSRTGASLPAEAGARSEPKVAPPGSPGASTESGYSADQLDRDIRAARERDLADFSKRCAKGEREYCTLATCLRVGFDDSDANLIACAKARGLRVGDGWVANDEGRLVPGVLRPPWSIPITCLRKVNGDRPVVRVWREFGVAEASFDLDAEARKLCQASYDEPSDKRSTRRR